MTKRTRFICIQLSNLRKNLEKIYLQYEEKNLFAIFEELAFFNEVRMLKIFLITIISDHFIDTENPCKIEFILFLYSLCFEHQESLVLAFFEDVEEEHPSRLICNG